MGTTHLGSVVVDLDRRTVEREGQREHLTTREAELLRHLLDAGGTVSRDELLSQVWGYSDAVFSRAVDNTVRRLRAKIEDDPSNPEVLLTVHGTGYRVVRRGPDPAPADNRPAAEPAPAPATRRYRLGDRTLDLDRQRIEAPDEAAALSGREIALLELLLAAGGASVDRDTLRRKIWGGAAGRALDHVIFRLRRKLERDPGAPQHLLTTATGYRLAVDDAVPDTSAPLAPAPSAPLPAELDRRFGRDAEVDEVAARFAHGDRLITLLGPAGVGKTRLALAAAHRLAAEGHRVVWVRASAARDRAALCHAVAQAVGVQLSTADASGVLARYFAAEPALWLVLDNLEQIEGAAVELARWLSAAAALRILTTSRIRLQVGGERDLVVAPLPSALAAALFADRAAYAIRPEEQDDVVAIVDALDGLPLAVELAAARTRAMSVAQVRAALDRPLTLLTSRQWDGPRSVRASLDASFAIASPAARAALCQLSTFEAPFRAETAAEVVDLSGVDPSVWFADVLQDLCDASLVRFDPDRDRYTMLGVVRQYAAESLSDEAREAAEARHGASFVRFAAEIAGGGAALRFGRRHVEAMASVMAELPELEAALDRAIARGDAGTAAVIAAAADLSWERRGPFAPAAARMEALLVLPMPPATRAGVSLLAGRLYSPLADAPRAEAHLHDALALAHEVGALEIEVGARIALARLHHDQGRVDEVRAESDAALALASARGVWWGECQIRMLRALELTDLDASHRELQEAERIATRHDARGLLGGIARRIAEIDVKRGRFDAAELSLARARGVAAESGSLIEQMAIHSCQAYLLRLQGRVAESLPFGLASAADCRRIGQQVSEVMSLVQVGWSLGLLGRADEAHDVYLQALAAARAASLRAHVSGVLNALGGLAAVRTDREHPLVDAQGWFREALQVSQEVGEPHREAMSQVNLGRVCCLLGDTAEGLALLHAGLDVYTRAGDDRRAGSALVLLAASLFDEGRGAEALGCLERAEQIARTCADLALADAVVAPLARVRAALGQVEAAEAMLAGLAVTDDNPREAEVWLARAEIAHARGDADGRRAALGEAERRVHPDTLGQRYRALAALDG